jgi:CheY-like chemotaxis protein
MEESVKKLKVMVVEDEELLLQAISKKLSVRGFEAVTCTSAKQALDYLSNLGELPDVIWLDYYLQDMNGLEFVKELRKIQEWSKIPVMVVSNSASDEKRNSMLALGVNKYVLKAQYRLEEIIDMISQIASGKKV